MAGKPGEKLPNGDKAVIPQAKLEGYLLSDSHVVGRTKARFFRSLGYTIANSSQLKEKLKTIAQRGQIVTATETDFGIKYEVRGDLSRQGQSVSITTVWIVEKGSSHPRLVTAYPTKRKD